MKPGPKPIHGERRCDNGRPSKEYIAWRNMIERCRNPNNPQYGYWGGRGIKVCQRWSNSFLNFLEDMGRAPSPTHSIDRKNNNGDYGPENCRWATKWEQGINRRTTILSEESVRKLRCLGNSEIGRASCRERVCQYV